MLCSSLWLCSSNNQKCQRVLLLLLSLSHSLSLGWLFSSCGGQPIIRSNWTETFFCNSSCGLQGKLQYTSTYNMVRLCYTVNNMHLVDLGAYGPHHIYLTECYASSIYKMLYISMINVMSAHCMLVCPQTFLHVIYQITYDQ